MAAAPPAPGSLNASAVNIFGLHQYDGQTTFFDGPFLLPEVRPRGSFVIPPLASPRCMSWRLSFWARVLAAWEPDTGIVVASGRRDGARGGSAEQSRGGLGQVAPVRERCGASRLLSRGAAAGLRARCGVVCDSVA